MGHFFFPFLSDWLSIQRRVSSSPPPRWLFHAEQAAHVGHKLLQALEEGHLLLAVHGGRRAAGRQLVEGVGQPLVDDGVPLRRQQSLHQLRVLRLGRGEAKSRALSKMGGGSQDSSTRGNRKPRKILALLNTFNNTGHACNVVLH